MDKQRAAQIALEHVQRLRALPYDRLLPLIDDGEHYKVPGEAGRTWKVDIEAFWDLQPGGNLRVIVSVDDGGFSHLRPLTRDFVKSPDDTVIDDDDEFALG